MFLVLRSSSISLVRGPTRRAWRCSASTTLPGLRVPTSTSPGTCSWRRPSHAPRGAWRASVPGADGDITLSGQTVRAKTYPPATSGATDAKEGPESEQRIAYVDAEGKWRVRLVAFCSRDPECPRTPDAWVGQQLGIAAREMALPILMVFVGGCRSQSGSRVLWTISHEKHSVLKRARRPDPACSKVGSRG